MLILVINSGSSSLKYQLREVGDTESVLAGGIVERIGVPGSGVDNHTEALERVHAELAGVLDGRTIDAAGHRVVHGGERFTVPALVTDGVIDAIEELSPLAPLHNPAAVQGLRAIAQKWPSMPQVVVFDTSFHQTMPERAWRYAVPDSLYTEHGIRRYGFHGTSHDLVTGMAAEHLGLERDRFNAVILHLGNGASATAVSAGRSVDTSMGYTPLAGLVMGTRSGDLDPSILTHLLRNGAYDVEQLDRLLNRESGLLGMTGHADMRQVVENAEAGDRHAQTALDVASYRLAKYVGAYHVASGGAQAVVFTAGIGENSAAFRALVLDRLGALGITYDAGRNLERSASARLISAEDSAIPVLVIPTDEENAIARLTVEVAREHGRL